VQSGKLKKLGSNVQEKTEPFLGGGKNTLEKKGGMKGNGPGSVKKNKQRERDQGMGRGLWERSVYRTKLWVGKKKKLKSNIAQKDFFHQRKSTGNKGGKEAKRFRTENGDNGGGK